MVAFFLTGPIVYSNYCQGQDSLVYQFKPKVSPRADNGYVHPLFFRIKLPAGLLHSYSSGFDSFGFLYPDKQVIYVYLNRLSQNVRDTSYLVPGDDEIDRLLLDDLNTVNSSSKLDIDNNPFDPKRGTWLIKRGKATILLYNIRKENMTRFLRFAGSFTFI